MKGNQKEYFDLVLSKSKRELSFNYNFSSFLSNEVDIINASHIDKILFSDKSHLYIKPLGKSRNANYYIPVLLAVSASTFLKNYCDDENSETSYKIGDILQDAKGKPYQINGIDDNRVELIAKIKGRGTKRIFRDLSKLPVNCC